MERPLSGPQVPGNPGQLVTLFLVVLFFFSELLGKIALAFKECLSLGPSKTEPEANVCLHVDLTGSRYELWETGRRGDEARG